MEAREGSSSSSSVSVEMETMKRKKLSFREEAFFSGLTQSAGEGKVSGKDQELSTVDVGTFIGSKEKVRQFRQSRILNLRARLIKADQHHHIVNEEHWYRHKRESGQAGKTSFGSRNVGGKAPTIESNQSTHGGIDPDKACAKSSSQVFSYQESL